MEYLLMCAGLLLIVFHLWRQERLTDRIAPPPEYVREICSDNSFMTYLRNLPLLPKGSKVLLYDGKEKANQATAFVVVDMEIGNRNLQQCVGAVIRLRAEHPWKHKRYAGIKFNFTSGFTTEYKRWAEGNRIKVNDNRAQWHASDKGADYSYKTFRNHLDMVLMYAGTASLSREFPAVLYTSSQPGDVFIKGDSPGHVVIVMDVAIHPNTGKKVLLLAQSHMSAQQIHILVNPTSRNLSPRYELTEMDIGRLYTPEWIFEKKGLERPKWDNRHKCNIVKR